MKIAMKISYQFIFPLPDESKNYKKTCWWYSPTTFFVPVSSAFSWESSLHGHRSILSFPGTWDQRESHVLSPLSPQFQVLFPSRMLNSWTFYPPLSQLDIPSALSIPGLSSRTWTDPGPALGFLNPSPNLISAWASLNSQTPCLGWWTHIF